MEAQAEERLAKKMARNTQVRPPVKRVIKWVFHPPPKFNKGVDPGR